MSNKELIRTVISMGLVDENQIYEMQRWGLIDRQLVLDAVPQTHEGMMERMNLALDVVGMDRKETDLAVLRRFMQTSKRGLMYVHVDGVDVRDPLEVFYGRTHNGDYILPWNGGPGQEHILINGHTYLETEDGKVYMMDYRPVYFDELQSFVVCKPGLEESRDGQRR